MEMGSCSSNSSVINQLINSQEIISGPFEWGLYRDSLESNGFDITVKSTVKIKQMKPLQSSGPERSNHGILDMRDISLLM